MSIRVALVEDHAAFAETLRRHIAASELDVSCVGVYPNAEDALRDLSLAPPDVAIVDIHLPRMNGIELVTRLKSASPSILCLILTTYEDGNLIFDALKAGACGYLLKRSPAADILSAILEVHAGGSPMSPQIARRVVSYFHQQENPREKGGVLEALSEREHGVLQLLAKGSMYKEIASDLSISIDTVRSHVRKIYDKLHVRSRTEAVLKYLGRQP